MKKSKVRVLAEGVLTQGIGDGYVNFDWTLAAFAKSRPSKDDVADISDVLYQYGTEIVSANIPGLSHLYEMYDDATLRDSVYAISTKGAYLSTMDISGAKQLYRRGIDGDGGAVGMYTNRRDDMVSGFTMSSDGASLKLPSDLRHYGRDWNITLEIKLEKPLPVALLNSR